MGNAFLFKSVQMENYAMNDAIRIFALYIDCKLFYLIYELTFRLSVVAIHFLS